jgi:hypothetical protein
MVPALFVEDAAKRYGRVQALEDRAAGHVAPEREPSFSRVHSLAAASPVAEGGELLSQAAAEGRHECKEA